MTNAFNEMHPNDQRDWLDTVKEHAAGTRAREDAADRRTEAVIGRLDLLLGAFAAGARAFADTIDRGPRR